MREAEKVTFGGAGAKQAQTATSFYPSHQEIRKNIRFGSTIKNRLDNEGIGHNGSQIQNQITL